MYDGAISGNPDILREFEKRRRNPKPSDSSLEYVSKMAAEAQAKYHYKGSSWSGENLREMAVKVGRDRVYDTVYRLYSQGVHSQPRTMNNYAADTPTGLVFSLAESDNFVEESLVTEFDFLYSIIGAADKHFEWGAEKVLDEVAERYVNAVGNINEVALGDTK
jgi:hypothetical protein